jgi:hypothetical protein
MSRSARADVRNPVLRLPEAAALADWCRAHPEGADHLWRLVRAISAQAHAEADRSWRQRKPPLAAYWRAMGVYARHIAAALRSRALTPQEEADVRALLPTT